MSSSSLDFARSNEREPHRAITRELLRKHPEIRQYLGKKTPWSILVILVGVALQVGAAWLMKDQPWWQAVLLAFFFGTLVNHSFIAMVHDCSHNTLFKGKVLNMLAGLFVNLPMFIPSFVSFKKYHMKHHSFQGVYELDADLPSEWEARWVQNSWWRKALWLAFYPLWQSMRTSRVKEIEFWDGWVVANAILVFGFDVFVLMTWGPVALLYLFVAFWAGFGLSITGGRLIQEHYMVKEDQETYSYYGWLAPFAFNVSYHNEHHDFPSAPWNHLAKIRKIASEHYNSLYYHTSWTKLVFKFIFDPKMSLYNRVLRKERGGVALDAEVKPDIEIGTELKTAGI